MGQLSTKSDQRNVWSLLAIVGGLTASSGAIYGIYRALKFVNKARDLWLMGGAGVLLAVLLFVVAYRSWPGRELEKAFRQARNTYRTALNQLEDAKNKAELEGEFAGLEKFYYDATSKQLDILQALLNPPSSSASSSASEGKTEPPQVSGLTRSAKWPLAKEEVGNIAKEMQKMGYQRAYLLPYEAVLVEAEEQLAEMRSWGVPDKVLAPLENEFKSSEFRRLKGAAGDLPSEDETRIKQRARALLESLYEQYDSWDHYTDWYLRDTLTPAVIALSLVSVTLIGICAWIAHLGVLAWVFAFAGAAGASVSVAIRPPRMTVYGEAVGSLLGIAGRVVAGTTASFVGMSLLASGLINIALPMGSGDADAGGGHTIRLVPLATMFHGCRSGVCEAGCRDSRVVAGTQPIPEASGSVAAGATSASPSPAEGAPEVNALGIAGAASMVAPSVVAPVSGAPVAQKIGTGARKAESCGEEVTCCPNSWMFLLTALAILLGFCERVLPSLETVLIQGITGPNGRGTLDAGKSGAGKGDAKR